MLSSSPLTPGRKIRDLRIERNLSLETLADKAEITTLTLSNIELKAAAPQRTNLINILDVLEAEGPMLITQRREILDAFGYLDSPGLPNEHDIRRAVAAWEKPFKKAPYPAYIVDFAQRIHDWNDRILLLMGEDRGSLKGTTIFDLLFSPKSRGNITLVNEEEVIRKMVTFMWHEYQPHLEEKWFKTFIATTREKHPIFGQMLDAVKDQDPVSIDIRAMGPIVLSDQDGHILTFQIVGTDLVSDPRFGVVQYLPLDQVTAQFLAITDPII